MRAAAGKAVASSEPSAVDRQRSFTWAQRFKQVLAIDIEVCRRCGGKLKVAGTMASYTNLSPSLTCVRRRRILTHAIRRGNARLPRRG